MRRQRETQAPQRFPSPTRDHATINPKFVDDCTRMTYAIQQSLPEAVRRIVRDHWEKCLLGSEFHQAFIVSWLMLRFYASRLKFIIFILLIFAPPE
jgi:hypothetical protein